MKYLQLFESYNSQKDLEYLTKIILYRIASDTFEKDVHTERTKLQDLREVKLKDFNPNNYDTLKQFIIEFGDLDIYIVPKEEFSKHANSNKASYLRITNNEGKVVQRIIMMILDEHTIKRVNEYIKEWDQDNTKEIIGSIAYFLHNQYKGSLIHELQHAYDDWRSKGKFESETDEFIQQKKKYSEISRKNDEIPADVKEEELDFLAQHHIKYLNLKHEVDARFSDAIQKTNFYEVDLDVSNDTEEWVYTMKPFNTVFRSFKSNIYPFIHLTDENKRRVLRKFGQFYELEKIFVDKLNKKEASE